MILFSEIFTNEFQKGADYFKPVLQNDAEEEAEAEELAEDYATGFADKNQKKEEEL